MELEKEGAGARKKARGPGIKEDISRAKWHEGKDGEDAWDAGLVMGMGSPRKNGVGTPNKSQVVPRKRTNANLLITPRKGLRQMAPLLGGDQSLNMGLSLSPSKEKEAGGSPVRKRKLAKKSPRMSMMLVDDAKTVGVGKHHARHSSLVFDFEMTSEQETEPKEEFEQSKSPKKTPKRQGLRRSMRGRASESVHVPEPVLTKVNNERSSHAGLDAIPREVEVDEGQTGSMGVDHQEDISPENEKSEVAGPIPTIELVEPLDIAIESAQTQTEDFPTQKSIKGAKQRRTSSRRSTRQSDRLHLESAVEKPLIVDADAMASNASTERTRDFTPEKTYQDTSKFSNPTIIPGPNLDLQEVVTDATTEEIGAHRDVSTSVENPTPAPIEAINHIVEELLEQRVPANDNTGSVEPQEFMLHAPTDDSSVELPANIHRQQAFSDFEDIQLAKENPNVAPFEDSDDEDMDDSMSELSQILLEPTINVANLGLSSSIESFDNKTSEMQNVAESDPVEDPGSFDLMPINNLHANTRPTNLESDIAPTEQSAAFTTTSEADDTFYLGATSSFENDDTDMLRQFLTRVKADKAAKAAAPPPKKRKSLPHSPVRIPLGDIMNAEASSPVQAPKDEFDISVPITSSPTRKSRTVTPPPTDEAHVEVEAKSIRRSGRTRPPAPKIPLPAPSSIPVRRLGGDDTTVTLKQSVEKELAALTRVNTRKNKAGAVLPEILLARKADGKENPAKRQRELRELFEEKVRREKKAQGKGKKSVVWKEELAQYQTFGGKEKKEKKMGERRERGKGIKSPGGERTISRDEGKVEDKHKENGSEAKEKKSWVKIPTTTGASPSSRERPSRIATATGIPTVSGTPARKKRLARS